MNVKLLLVRAVRAFRRYGILRTLHATVSCITTKYASDEFDSAHGTDTSGAVRLWRLKIDSRNAKFGTRYETSDPRNLEQCLKHVPREPRSLCFIDMGCGKGRMLIAAKELGFRKIIGVEFAPELVDIARRNLAKSGATDVLVLHTDAAEFCFPREDGLLVYLFNPFSEEVMKGVLENLREALPTTGYVVYNNARCAELLDRSGFLRRIASVAETPRLTAVWSIETDAN